MKLKRFVLPVSTALTLTALLAGTVSTSAQEGGRSCNSVVGTTGPYSHCLYNPSANPACSGNCTGSILYYSLCGAGTSTLQCVDNSGPGFLQSVSSGCGPVVVNGVTNLCACQTGQPVGPPTTVQNADCGYIS